jgi:mono/diheme cytochrome c family protein
MSPEGAPVIRSVSAIFFCVLLALAAVSCMPAPEPVPGTADVAPRSGAIPAGDPVEGLRIAKRVGCTGCHEDDGRGGGFDHDSPAGDRFVAPNLTERRGLYDDDGFVALLREGRTHDSHRPVGMPVHMFQFLAGTEVRDLTAWMRALPSVSNPELAEGHLSEATRRQLQDGSFPYDDDLPDRGNRPPAARPSEPLALGKHLAMTSCTECHGRDLNGWGPEDDTPSLIVAKTYTDANFARLMKTGIAATGKDTATGRMSKIARSRFAELTDDEVRALKLYLDSR